MHSKPLLAWVGPAGLLRLRSRKSLFGGPLRLCLRNHWAAGCNASNFASRDFTGAVRRLCKSSIHIYIEGWGEAQPGNRFGSVVRAYARSGSEVGIGENLAGRPLSLFPFAVLYGISFEFCVVLVNPGEI